MCGLIWSGIDGAQPAIVDVNTLRHLGVHVIFTKDSPLISIPGAVRLASLDLTGSGVLLASLEHRLLEELPALRHLYLLLNFSSSASVIEVALLSALSSMGE